MSRLPAALIAVCVCAAGCSRPGSDVRDRSAAEPAAGEGVARTAGETPAASRPRVVFLGDSLTAGYGLAREQSVPSLIQKRLDDAGYNYEVVNHGVSGDTSAGGVSRLEWALDGDVRVMVLELGANDGLRGVPVESMKALKFFYYKLGDKLWGEYGFHDAFSLDQLWFADSYLAIDQGPIVVMIENHRTALPWKLFMSSPEIKNGLTKLGFNSPAL